MGRRTNGEYKIQSNQAMDAKLYATNYNELADLIEDNLLLAYLNSKNESMKRSVVRAVASALLVVDIAKIAGVGGEAEDGRVGENGCLPHSNSKKIPKNCGWCDQYDSIEKTCLHKVRKYSPDVGMDFKDFHYQFWQTDIRATCHDWEPRHPEKPVPHSNSPEKIPYFTSKGEIAYIDPPKNLKNYEDIGKRICSMLESLDQVELTDEEWDDSYRLYVKRRNTKKRKESTARAKCL
jgi:hypothetical protein